MAVLTVQQAVPAGLAASAASAAGGGDQYPNNGKTLLKVINGGGSSIDVTIAPTNTVKGYSLEDIVVAVAGGATKYLGPYEPALFNNSSGRVAVAYSSVTSVTVAAISL
jgi:hypothetical protein